MRRRIKRVYKSLPPHSYEAHPLATSGEVSKPLIIGIIAIVAVIALSLLLLFSDQFVGKALYPGQVGTAGLVYPQTVYENNDFTLQVKANVGNEMAAGVEFELSLPPGVTCKSFVELFDANVSSFTCDPNKNEVAYVGGKFDTYVTGELDIARITFNGVSAGGYDFHFSEFEVKKADKSPIAFPDVLALSTLEVKAAPTCADGIKNGQEADVDCGSLLGCLKCADAKMCSTNADCQSGKCVNNECVAVPASCFNNMKDVQETDADCGGPDCQTCIDSKMCSTNADCQSNSCASGVCEPTPPPPPPQQVCKPDTWSCEGTNAKKQCKSDASGYNAPISCASEETCSNGVCGAVQPPTPSVSVQGTKITLTDVAPAGNVFATQIKATETFTEEVTIYTTLYDSNGKVLALKLEKLTGLAFDKVYTATMHYPEANVKTKSVIVYNVKQNPTVFGNLEVETS